MEDTVPLYYSFGLLYHPVTRKALLNRRSDDAPIDADMWALFGGGSEIGDGNDPITTWQREMQEELGITLARQQIISLRDDITSYGNRRYDFYCEWSSLQTDFVLQEGKEFAWFTFNEALALPNLTEGARNDLLLLQARVDQSGSARDGLSPGHLHGSSITPVKTSVNWLK